MSGTNLAIFTHKPVWRSKVSSEEYLSDGGFPLQFQAIGKLFDSVTLAVSLVDGDRQRGGSPLEGKCVNVEALSELPQSRWRRKFAFPWWFLTNGPKLWRCARRADAIHVPIPGDIGTLGMLLALLLRKPLFVRYCGTWGNWRTTAEHFWKWLLERVAGGPNVVLATGLSRENPSAKNSAIKWIFATSLGAAEMEQAAEVRTLPQEGCIRLITVARQEPAKGTDRLIEAMAVLVQEGRFALDVVGDGSAMPKLQEMAASLPEGTVTFHGQRSRKEVSTLLRAAHIFCFPTRSSEGFPKALLEAMAHGLPCVASAVSAIPEMLADQAGIVVSDTTPSVVAGAVRACVADAEAYAVMSQRALQFARDHSLENWQQTIKRHLQSAWSPLGIDIE